MMGATNSSCPNTAGVISEAVEKRRGELISNGKQRGKGGGLLEETEGSLFLSSLMRL